MPKSFADEIRDRLPRMLTNLVMMLAVIVVLYLIMPVAYVTSYVIPGVGLAGGLLIGIGALIISLIIEVRIYRDLEGLSNAFASYAVAKRKRLTAPAKERLRSSLADIGKAVSLLILLAPVLIIIPGIGVIAVILPIVGILVLALYGWKSWEAVEEELQKIFKAFANSVAKSFEK
jgi:uncharacterized membrane protein